MAITAGQPMLLSGVESEVLAPVEELAQKMREVLEEVDGKLTISQVFAATNAVLINVVSMLSHDEKPLSIIALEANAQIAQNAVIGFLLQDVKPS